LTLKIVLQNKDRIKCYLEMKNNKNEARHKLNCMKHYKMFIQLYSIPTTVNIILGYLLHILYFNGSSDHLTDTT